MMATSGTFAARTLALALVAVVVVLTLPLKVPSVVSSVAFCATAGAATGSGGLLDGIGHCMYRPTIVVEPH